MSVEPRYDACIVGGGLIGLAVARALLSVHVGISLLIIDKEDRVAAHQSGHNSGVIHSGLYYRPGSLKARLAVEGRNAIYQLAENYGIAHERSGKLVIASDASELPALEELQRRGTANGLTGLRRLRSEEIGELEPEAAGITALHVPEAGVVDFTAIASHLAAELVSAGADLMTGHVVTAIEHTIDGVAVVTDEARFRSRVAVNCAGLQSDRVAALAGVETDVRIVPFRGEYYRLGEAANGLVRALIYPVPDPRFPFLGVHFTRRADGMVEVGPNAVLALGREQYRDTGPDWFDLWEAITYPGFVRLAMRHWREGIREMVQSRSRRLYARMARRLVPALRKEDLIPGDAGVRAQAVRRDGTLVDDFVIERTGSMVHILNAPSPGATASLAIGRYVAERVGELYAR